MFKHWMEVVHNHEKGWLSWLVVSPERFSSRRVVNFDLFKSPFSELWPSFPYKLFQRSVDGRLKVFFLLLDCIISSFQFYFQLFWNSLTGHNWIWSLPYSVWGGGGALWPPYSFSLISPERLELRPSNFQTFSFYLWAIRKI